jgi:hypothetical protein
MEEIRKRMREYHKGTPQTVERADGIQCTNPCCTSGECDYCRICGFNTEEAERRRKIPMTEYTYEVKDGEGNVVATETRRRKFLARKPKPEED